ncbi:MAG: alkaline phosphatase PhoX [Flavobacteriaceae bacterium]
MTLQPDPNGYLDLPKGFSYKIISKSGTPMSDGLLVPGRPDGMGTFLINILLIFFAKSFNFFHSGRLKFFAE